MHAGGSTIDDAELGRFAAQADAWWDPAGSLRMLHRLNPVRVGFIRSRLARHFRRDSSQLRPFVGLGLADIGCGGGLVAEPMARLGFNVTGIDAGSEAIDAARVHAAAAGLDIDYRVADVESMADAGLCFDAVLALEVVEHVADRDAFLGALARLLAPEGVAVVATLNRTARSFALAIVGAEYLLGWLPRGTHDWRKFVRPSELALGLRRNHLRATEIAGVGYNPIRGGWALSSNLDVNYLVVARR
ncbi:MAG: bifunctional 2-polyprenyl-6-hydroxyphenol methylase/3-demethylubiquinol 3-O-methyltransferase UbiG [Stellaceae bacterium]